MSERKTYFVNVILPLALPRTFTYRLPQEWNDFIQIGQRVIVEFGRGKKQYSAIVEKIHEQAPTNYQAKYIEAILDESPILHQNQLDFWWWISEYYMSPIGDVMNAALPGGLRLASETRVLLHPNYQELVNELSDEEYILVEALEVRNVLDLSEISQILGIKHVHSKVKNLIEKRVVMTEEEIKQRFKPKMIDYVKLTKNAAKESRLKEIFEELERAPKQLEALMTYIQMAKYYSQELKEVKKLDLQKAVQGTSSLINELVKKGVFEIYQVEAGRLQTSAATQSRKDLNEFQQKAFGEIKQHYQQQDVVLLHGVTSSGKTEIYIKLIEEAVKSGKQVLYLLPEIALTTQIVLRLQAIFGEKVGVYHSRFNENERVEVWNNVLKFNPGHFEDFQIILGARSSLFLPFSQLGLVIVDEEHENTFKQYDPSPRYQARDAAIVLAKMQNAKVLLGSATPSVESYRNTQEGKYGLVSLNKRHGKVQLPEILVADIKDATKKKKMKSHFSPELLKMMEECLEENKQVILFQNRRGYSPIMMCESCGNSPTCVNCDVSLTYHKFQKQLNCHYCGYHIKLPNTCPTCGDTNLHVKGFGTEKIEEELAIFLPEAKIARMDLDTTRAKKAYHQIITSFQEKEIDILVGTQMVTKGLDFEDIFDDSQSTATFNQTIAYLSGEGSIIRFPHDTWADVIEGHGTNMNPFKAVIQDIRRKISDSKYEEYKRLAVTETWEQIVRRYRRNSVREKDSFLSLSDILTNNFTLSELEKDVDVEMIREVCSSNSELPIAARVLSRIQAAKPTQINKIININDSVINRSNLNFEGDENVNDSVINK